MKLSSAYILEQLKKEYRIQEQREISGEDGYLRPFFCLNYGKETAGHVKIAAAKAADSGEQWEIDRCHSYMGFKR